jgi:hypothetical protein
MKRSAVFVVLLALVVTLGVAGTGFSGHKEEKGLVVPVEYEITIKDDHGKETKARVKDVGDVKVGDNVTIQGGKAKKAIKPKTGGY